MQAWVGNVIGSSIGLVAILIGALWNAHLTRKRDKLLRQEEVSALRAALAGELAAAMELTAGRLFQVGTVGNGLSGPMLQALKPPDLVLWPKLCDRLGWLDGALAAQVIKAFSLLEWQMCVLRACVDEAAQGNFDGPRNRRRREMFARDMRMWKQTIAALGGELPEGLLLPEYGV